MPNRPTYALYIPANQRNEATSYYIDLICSACEQSGATVRLVERVEDIACTDRVVTIGAKSFMRIWLKRLGRGWQAHWFQGIAPEEIRIAFAHRRGGYPRVLFHTALERIVLRCARLNLFVSETMWQHYRKKYGRISGAGFVMPCFNQALDAASFTPEHYAAPSFVYAGGMNAWQCIPQTLDLFKRIKAQIPAATLTILTGKRDVAAELCRSHGVEATIDFVPLQQLQSVLKRYKYGFIVRDDIAVNHVATPTKMNSYMAAGVIPVYSDVVGDFKSAFKDVRHKVAFRSEAECLAALAALEGEAIDPAAVAREYAQVFSTYYAPERYVAALAEVLRAS